MKFATHVLFYNVDQFILKNIDNSGPHVDRIYVAYSKKPWGYNRKARKKFSNLSNLDLHPVNPKVWARAIEYDQELPEVLSEHLDESIPSPTETKKKCSIWKKIVDMATICKLFIIYFMI